MDKYLIVIAKPAQKQLDKLDDTIADPILEAIGRLSSNPRPHGYKKLKGNEGYRIRQGDYRIIYDIRDNILVVEVVAVGNRKDIYG